MISLDISGKLPNGVTKSFVEKMVRAAYRRAGGRGKELFAVSVVNDREMKELNRQYRGQDSTTDVLSFAYHETGGFPCGFEDAVSSVRGDIVISVEQVRRQARQIGRSVKVEFALMLVHGTLHLMGYDHMTVQDETEMFRLQHEILTKEGLF